MQKQVIIPSSFKEFIIYFFIETFKSYETIIQFSPGRRVILGKISYFAGQQKPPPLCKKFIIFIAVYGTHLGFIKSRPYPHVPFQMHFNFTLPKS